MVWATLFPCSVLHFHEIGPHGPDKIKFACPYPVIQQKQISKNCMGHLGQHSKALIESVFSIGPYSGQEYGPRMARVGQRVVLGGG